MNLPSPSSHAHHTASSAIRDLLTHARRSDVISLAGGVPAPETFPLEILRDATAKALGQGTDALQYGLTVGEVETREVLARCTAAGLAPSVDDVVVTTGSQQGIELVTRAYVDPGDVVVVGAAEYLGAVQVFRSYRAAVHVVPVDHGGLDVDHLGAALAEGLRPKLVYTVPNYHNPTGATLAPSRAERLANLAETYGFLVIEDDPYRDLSIGQPTVIGHGSDNIVRLRSASKVLAPGLRCGWLVANADIVARIGILKQSIDLHTSTLSQAIVAHAFADPRFTQHLGVVRAYYRRQRDALVDAVRAQLPHLTFVEPTGGMFLWLSGTGVETTDLLSAAVDAGVAYVPGSVFDPSGGPSDHIRLSFATASAADFHRGCAILAGLIPHPETSMPAGVAM